MNMRDAGENFRKLDIILEKAQRDIERQNKRKRYDINKQWERIAMFILNIAYSWDLEDLNLLHPNFPGIDLGDYKRHIGVQVSTENTPGKIRDSLKKVQSNKINGRLISDDYYIIYFFVPGDRGTSNGAAYDIGENIIFSTENIMDFNTFRDMFKDLENEKQEAILAVLNRELFKKPKYQLSAVPVTACNFIEGSRRKEMDEIDEKFSRSNIVFLWGLGGIGKTELAVEWGLNREDVYLVYYKKSIMDTVLNMEFSGMEYIPSKQGMTDQEKKEEEFNQRLDILREYYQGATIIIDNFDDSDMTFVEMRNQPDYKKLIRLKNKFLFTTRFVAGESSIHVTEMDIKDLLKLVKQNYSHFEDEEQSIFQSEGSGEGKYDEILKELIMRVDKHTLTVDLIGKTLYESFGRLTPEKLLAAFNEKSMDDLRLPLIEARHNSNDSDYELKEYRIYGHLQRLFNVAEFDDIHKNVMRHAVLIPIEGMSVGMFRRCHTVEEQSVIEAKIFHRSWLRLDRTHTIISVHPVIREVCRRELKPDDENCKQFLYSLRNCVNLGKDNQKLIRPVADIMGNAAEILPDTSAEWSRAAGDYYRLLGMYQKAIYYLKKASEIRSGYADLILADIYSSVGNTYTNLKEFESSIMYHGKSLMICQCMSEPDNKRIARRYNDMGVAYSHWAEEKKELGLYKKAIECHKKTLEINKREKPLKKKYISNSLNNLGNTYSNIGKTWHKPNNYKRALQYHLNAKNIREAIPNISVKMLASSNKNIGNDYANLNINDKALKYRTEALELYREVLHDGHPELANAYQDVGNTCRLTKDYDEALKYYMEAEKIWKKQLPQNYFPLAKCQYAIGTIWLEQAAIGEEEQYERALKYYIRALDCYEKDTKSNKSRIARCKGTIGEIYNKLGKRNEAIKYLKESHEIHNIEIKKSKSKQIKRNHHLGEMCKKDKRFDEALEYFCNTLELREKYFSHDVANLMEDNFEIGCIYRDLRMPQNAMPYLEKAFEICNKHFSDDKKKLHRIEKTMEITDRELRKNERRTKQ